MAHDRQLRILDEITQNLRQSREQKGLTHEAVAKKAKLSRSTISHIESNTRRPSLLVALRISESLGIKLSEVLCLLERRIK